MNLNFVSNTFQKLFSLLLNISNRLSTAMMLFNPSKMLLVISFLYFYFPLQPSLGQ